MAAATSVDADDNEEEEMFELVEPGNTIPFLVQTTLGKTGTGLTLVRGEMSFDDLSVRPLDFGFEDFAELPRTFCLLDSYKIRNKTLKTFSII